MSKYYASPVDDDVDDNKFQPNNFSAEWMTEWMNGWMNIWMNEWVELTQLREDVFTAFLADFRE